MSDPQALPEHGVTVVFVELDNVKLELLQPLGDSSPIAGFLAKNPSGGMHHLCMEVPDVKVRPRASAPSQHNPPGGGAQAASSRPAAPLCPP